MWFRLAFSFALFIWSLAVLLPGNRAAIRRGLDLRGGTSITLEISADALAKTSEGRAEQLKKLEEIMRRRIDAFGVSEPIIRRRGSAQLEIQLPGTHAGTDGTLIDTIKKPAKLEFRLLHEHAFKDIISIMPPVGYEWIDQTPNDGVSGSAKPVPVLVRDKAELLGNAVKSAHAVINSSGGYEVSLQLTADGARLFERITRDNLGKPLGIILDGKLYSAPVIRSVIGDGRAAISGNFTAQEARNLANVLNNPLDFELLINEVSEIGPTLAKEMQAKAVKAAYIGCGLVAAIMVGVYAFGGLMAVLSVALNVLTILGVLATIDATMTLPGIAALVLTAGMSVDANIIIFARMREELRSGKSTAEAVAVGFKRAFRTILDANLTTLFAAIVMAICGTGPVRGFGIIFAIGVVSTLFCILVFCRGLMEFGVKILKIQHIFFPAPRWNFEINFMKWRNVAFLFSGLLLLGGLGAMVTRGKNLYAIDFAGGEEMTIAHTGKFALGDIYAAAGEVGIQEVIPAFQKSGAKEKELKVQIPTGTGALLLAKLQESLPQCEFQLQRQTSVGSTISAALRWNALISVSFALLVIFAYMAVRFRACFGISAVVAIVHDIWVSVGIYALFGYQFNASTLAAVLMIIGYSINDTIIIFDRIREEGGCANGGLMNTINRAINRTISRTLLTSLTTLVVAIALFVWGAGAAKDFALLFLIGILIGTFSSIFIASALLLVMDRRCTPANSAKLS
jgi:SecD/SecF fusion protein